MRSRRASSPLRGPGRSRAAEAPEYRQPPFEDLPPIWVVPSGNSPNSLGVPPYPPGTPPLRCLGHAFWEIPPFPGHRTLSEPFADPVPHLCLSEGSI